MIMKKKKKAVYDCDGVCLDFDSGFATVGSDVLERPLSGNSFEYDLCKKYNITKDEERLIWKEMENHYSGWAGLPVMEDAISGFTFLKKNGFEIHLVTGIEEHLAAMRLENLRRHGMEVDSIICVGHGTASKMRHIREIDPLLFVDDRLQHINEAAFVPNRVWVDLGQDQFGLEKDATTVRVKSLGEWVSKYGKEFIASLDEPKVQRQVTKPKKLKMGVV
jgi:uncharacterized HAD superfamily protein